MWVSHRRTCYTPATTPLRRGQSGHAEGIMRTLTLVLTAILLVLAGTLALVEPGFTLFVLAAILPIAMGRRR